jgi:hypothetical protein
VSFIWEVGTYARIRSSSWIGRGVTRQVCLCVVFCVLPNTSLITIREAPSSNSGLESPGILRNFSTFSATLGVFRDKSQNFAVTSSI